jgi:hypothetical protein
MAAPASDRSSDSSFGARATVESSIFANLATARGISNPKGSTYRREACDVQAAGR